MTQDTIGFVGTGLMGEGMARNILKAGYNLHVITHKNRAPVDRLVAEGAKEAPSLETMAKTCNVIHICAPGSPQVEAIVAALLPHLVQDSVIIDCSTSDPVSTMTLNDTLEAQGCHMVDAPLGGTPVQAEAGELAVMLGAGADVLERAKSIISSWAGPIVHIGPPGSGHKMKLLNNMLAMGYAALYSEALALSEKAGIPTATFDSVISGSRMDCGFYQTFRGYAVEGNRESHKFTLTNALKDMTYLENLANSVGLDNSMGNAIKRSLALAKANGGAGPEDYVPHLVDFVANRNGVTRS
ncbi:NAD(P)-dependent oxidoreductase [Primorskyibacter sp. S187A]|uniref:NAD(P)-dependent oxidoreductase n=1 Tax=Primorskyibacter sp. S187A TaxID=3415130 RepID=UPI003C7A0810